ncbi:MAG TPA: lipopolysaccharide heptosyltransferase II [Candidatus Eisenbacteria bacterium]|nr:lipopolysaccharide heptosyltransferase II [Candidatus Eisenbacteria bacterium]
MEPRPLLVRLPNWLGDLVLAWPVVEAAAREGAILVGPAPFEPILLARFPRARYLAWSRERRYALAGAIRAARPRAALLLTESFSSALLAFLAGVPERIGYAAEGRGFLLTRRVAREAPARSTPRSAEYRSLALAARVPATAGDPALAATEGERASARDLLARRRADTAASAGSARADDAGYLVVAAGAAYGPAKQWGAVKFGEAAAAIAGERGLAIVAVGSPSDRPAGAEAVAAVRGANQPALDVTGETDLPALIGIVAGASIVLTNDSGVMHLAAALGRPTVAIFGSTSPLWTSASAPWVRNLYAAYPCSPCFRRTCSIGYGCLRAIPPSAAVEAARSLAS